MIIETVETSGIGNGNKRAVQTYSYFFPTNTICTFELTFAHMDLPLVSIISPTYNHEKFIAECIESVLAQSYQNWEMHIMDDGSTDETGAVAQSYRAKDPRIHYHYQPNVGVHRLHETYNKALGLCNGDYIAILECDDIWFPDKLERQVASMENRSDCVLAWASAYNSRENIADILKTQPDPEQKKHRAYFENNPIGIIARSIYFGNYVPALTILIRKESLLDIGGFQYLDNLPLIDQPTLLQLCLKGHFYYDEKPLGTWRRYVGQTTKKLSLDIMDGVKKYVYMHFDSLSAEQKHTLGIDRETIDWNFCTMEMTGRATYARACLMRKEFAAARRHYTEVLFFPRTFNLMWRLRALVGICFSFLKMDIEGLARLLGKRHYK
jgi:glycosyltransferase involved in cell wall biosynthesis